MIIEGCRITQNYITYNTSAATCCDIDIDIDIESPGANTAELSITCHSSLSETRAEEGSNSIF